MTLRENLNLWPASEQLLLYWPGERIPSSNIVNRQNRTEHSSKINFQLLLGVSNQSPGEQKSTKVTQKDLTQVIGHKPTTGLSLKLA